MPGAGASPVEQLACPRLSHESLELRCNSVAKSDVVRRVFSSLRRPERVHALPRLSRARLGSKSKVCATLLKCCPSLEQRLPNGGPGGADARQKRWNRAAPLN